MSGQKYRVLAADDDPTVRLLLQAALHQQGFAVTVLSDGIAALAHVLGGGFDLVLLDVEMPGMDGLSVCEAIRQSAQRDIPVVLVTGRKDAEFFHKLSALGAYHLAKPLDWSSLGHGLHDLLTTAG